MRAVAVFALAWIPGCKQPAPPPMVIVDAPRAAVGPAPTDPLPFDPLVRRGQLPNGLTYLIRRSTEPRERAVFRLAVDVGSLAEHDDQRGLAHVVEHMAFNGTEAYPGDALVKYLESTGTRFGAHLNAHTSFDQTVYSLVVPSSGPTYDEAFAILHQWSCCILFDEAQIEQERQVVVEEWRRRLGPSQRYWDRMAPEVYRGAPHAQRMPIGDEESLKSFQPDALRRFYRDWYRPDRMTVVLTGEVDVDAAEERVRTVFADLSVLPDAPERPEPRLAMAHPRSYVIAADPEADSASMTWIAKRDEPIDATFGDLEQTLQRELAVAIVNTRLSERSLDPEAGYLRAVVSESRWNPDQAGVGVQVWFDEGQELAALRGVWTEVVRLEQHGALEGELERAKQVLLERYRRLEADQQALSSVALADQLVRHAVGEEPVMGVVAEVEHGRRLVQAITLDQVNRSFDGLLRSEAEVFGLVRTEQEDGDLPTPEAVEAVLAEVEALQLQPPTAEAVIEELVGARPTPGTIEAVDRRYETLGVTGWTFANGIQVWFKRTDFKSDEVRMAGWIEGGHSGVADDRFLEARAAASVVDLSGLGEHDVDAVRRFFEGRRASLGVQIEQDRVAFAGTASPRDLELQLQKLWLTTQRARLTEEGLETTQARWRARLRNRSNSPTARFTDAWNAQSWPDEPRLAPATLEQVDRIELEAVQQVWGQAMAGLGRARFVFVGNLGPGFEQRVATWIGGLPGPRDGLERVARPDRAAGDLKQTIQHGVDDRATLRIEHWGDLEVLGAEERLRYDATADILAVLLREKLREDLGGVYGVTVGVGFSHFPTHRYRFRVELGCDPQRLDELEAAVHQVLAQVASEGVDERYVQAEIAKNLAAHQERERTNGFWLSHLASSLERREDPRWVLAFAEMNAALKPAIVQEIVASALDSDRRATLKMLPEG